MLPDSVYGYAGRILRVDLTSEKLSDEVLDQGALRKWVGGVGFGAKFLYDEVPPGVEWDDPENRLIIASGPLGGTRMGGSGNSCLVTKGCLTNGATSTQANGFMGAYMKFSGYDAIIVQGIAKRWVYLYLHDNTAELRDAGHLVGKNTWETEDTIKTELGYAEKGLSVFCVGPAGENTVRFAGVFGDKDHCAGHNGVGAVMGKKRLKAYCAARGRASVLVKEPQQLSKAVEAIWETTKNSPLGHRVFSWGTGGSYEDIEGDMKLGRHPVKNYTTSVYPPETRLICSQHSREQWSAKWNPCWACRMHHCHMITFTDGPYAGQTVEEPESEMNHACGNLVGNVDPAETLMLNHLLTLLGLEGNEAGFVVSMVIELYEKGVLTQEQTEGLDLRWGKTDEIRKLLERIARREGVFASILAEGTMRAANALGPEAQACGVYALKGQSPRTHDDRSRWRELFDTATSDIGTFMSDYIGPADPDSQPPVKDKFSPEEVSTYVARAKGRRQFEDMLGTCWFCTSVPFRQLLDAVNAVTGWDVTPKEAEAAGFRVANLFRAFNLRHGITVDVEAPSPRWSSSPVDGQYRGISIRGHWERMLDNYYRHMGWERKTGRPFPQTLEALGLGHIIPDLWK